jgi:hypothetical protein
MANAYAIFQNIMNEILWDLIDNMVIIYINDILIYLDQIEK